MDEFVGDFEPEGFSVSIRAILFLLSLLLIRPFLSCNDVSRLLLGKEGLPVLLFLGCLFFLDILSGPNLFLFWFLQLSQD